jgi:fibronectin-binding autotransporter adhesin
MTDACVAARQVGIRQRSLGPRCRMGRATQLVFVLVTGVTLALSGRAEAQTWDGETSTDWTVATNWDPDALPIVTDTATIDGSGATNPAILAGDAVTVDAVTVSGGTLTVSGALTAGSVTISGTGTVRVEDGIAPNGVLTGTVGVESGGKLSVAGLIDGTVRVNAGTLELDGGIIDDGTPTHRVEIQQGGIVRAISDSTLDGALIDVIANETGTITAADGVTLTLATADIARRIDSTTTFGTAGVAGTVVIAPTEGVTIGNNSVVNVAGGTLKVGSAFVGSVYFSSGMNISTSVDAGATIDMNGFNTSIQRLSGAGTITNDGAAAATLTLNNPAGGDTTFSGVIEDGTSAVALTKSGAGTLTLSGANTYTGTTTISAGTLQIGNGGTTGTLGTGNVVNNAALVFNRSNDITVANVISGTGSLTKEGAGTLTLTGVNNAFTGAVEVIAGTLAVTGDGTLGTTGASQILVRSGSTLETDGGALAADVVVILTGAGSTVRLTGDETVRGLSTAEDTTVDLDGGTVTITGNPTFIGRVTGSGGITASGPSAVVRLEGTNDYTGTTTITGGGRVRVVGGAAIADTAAVEIVAGTFELLSSETIGTLSGAGSVALNDNVLTIAGSGSTTYSGVVSGTGGLTKTGTGTLTLAGANTYSGATNVNEGTLGIRNGGALGGTQAGTSVAAGATLAVSGGITVAEAITLNGTGVANGGALRNLSGTNALSGAITLGSAARINSDAGELILTGGITGTDTNLTVGGAGRISINSVIATGAGSLTVDATTDAGVVALTAANTFTGGTTVNSGILQLLNGAALADSGALIVNASGTVQVIDGETVGALSGSGRIILQTTGALVVGDGSDTTFSGVIEEFEAAGTFTKQGTGTLWLTGANTYTGTTTISAGTLRVGAGGTTGTLGTGAVINNAALVFDRSNALTVANAISGSGSVRMTGTGTLILSGTNTFTGGLTVDAGIVALSGGAALADTNAVTVELDAILRLIDSERMGTLTNRGTVDLSGGNGVAGTVLTINGNYNAASDLVLDVVLGDDNSAADRLVVEGDTSGTTNVYIVNQGGTGALTGTGILLVDVEGSSDGTFVLANADTLLPGDELGISAGVFVYALRNLAGDWVLQSQFQGFAVAYEALPSALLGLTRGTSLSQRLAGRKMMTSPKDDGLDLTASSKGGAAGPAMSGAWLSVRASDRDVTPGLSATGLSYDQSAWRVQAGLDVVLSEGAGGTWVVGGSVFNGGGELQARSALGDGLIATDATGAGLTATWYGDTGFYGDLQLEYSRFESDLSASAFGELASDVRGSGRFASVEVGKTMALQNGLRLTPQAQISWAKVSMDSFTGTEGTLVSVPDQDSLQLQLGLAAERVWTNASGAESRIYGLANLTQEFRAATSVLIDGVALDASGPDLTAEIGIGGSIDWQQTGGGMTSLYGEVTALQGLGGGDMTGVSGTAGLRVTW